MRTRDDISLNDRTFYDVIKQSANGIEPNYKLTNEIDSLVYNNKNTSKKDQ